MVTQTFVTADLGVVAFLVLLEGLLSADNALVLAIMVRHLPGPQQRKALLYGLGGAFLFRLIAIILATKIIALWWLQAVGAIYLLWLPLKHFFLHSGGKAVQPAGKGFWPTVIAVEVADIAFAIDSVLAAVAMVKGQDKIWVVYTGAIIGVILLRFAAGFFIRLMDRFPRLDDMAYLLVGWVGVKLAFMAAHNGTRVLAPSVSVPEMSILVFWGMMALICVGGSWYAVRQGNQSAGDAPDSALLPSDDAPRLSS